MRTDVYLELCHFHTFSRIFIPVLQVSALGEREHQGLQLLPWEPVWLLQASTPTALAAHRWQKASFCK